MIPSHKEKDVTVKIGMSIMPKNNLIFWKPQMLVLMLLTMPDKVNSNAIVDLSSSFNIQEYFDSNLILAKNYDFIFNVEFQKLYEFAIGINSISPDFIQMENIEFGIEITQIVFYARDRTEYDHIYEKSLHVNRLIIPSV